MDGIKDDLAPWNVRVSPSLIFSRKPLGWARTTLTRKGTPCPSRHNAHPPSPLPLPHHHGDLHPPLRPPPTNPFPPTQRPPLHRQHQQHHPLVHPLRPTPHRRPQNP